MTVYIINDDNYSKLPELMRCLQPGDVIQILGGLGGSTFNTILVDGAVGSLRQMPTGGVEIYQTNWQVRPQGRPVGPNRGPYASDQPWKKRHKR